MFGLFVLVDLRAYVCMINGGFLVGVIVSYLLSGGLSCSAVIRVYLVAMG